jgi:hypothetical protein
MYFLKTDNWYLERLLYLMAGILTLASAILTWAHSMYWLILTVLVGLNLLVFALTGFCPSANVFFKLGVKPKLQRAGKEHKPENKGHKTEGKGQKAKNKENRSRR